MSKIDQLLGGMSDPRRPLPPPAPPPLRPAPARAPTAPTTPKNSQRARPTQFSLRTLLIGVTFVAFASALLGFIGPAAPVLAVIFGNALFFVMPICFGTLALYARGIRQTFFIGAFVGSCSLLLTGADVAANWPGVLLLLALKFATAMGCGYLAVATRRYAERRGWHVPPKASDSDSVD